MVVNSFTSHISISPIQGKNSVVSDGKDILQQLIRSRSYLFTPNENSDPVVKFFEDQLEADIVSVFVVGKPIIEMPRSQPFSFKRDKEMIM